MPLDENGNVYQPVLDLPAGLCLQQELYLCRFTGELFSEYTYVSFHIKNSHCKFEYVTFSMCRVSILLVWAGLSEPDCAVSCRDYLKALSQYRSRIWKCARTGMANMTFEEALTSEANPIFPKVSS